ncbi:hypothetical protein [Dehalococcoides mccartyi]|uniref:Uncharacterized protein n=1 Tax=Dehalococcoides mccartyi (strain CBDB1) TaxID=255470 RepID=A0A916KLM6_DEHMC|nr:hypothetical protein [Dehalococcoides mccartyi]CAI82458.1 hypothetical protein cbdbA214 [Dehalococcoides mccartyi CBDB1]
MLFVPLLAGQIARARPEMRGVLVSPLKQPYLGVPGFVGLAFNNSDR